MSLLRIFKTKSYPNPYFDESSLVKYVLFEIVCGGSQYESIVKDFIEHIEHYTASDHRFTEIKRMLDRNCVTYSIIPDVKG